MSSRFTWLLSILLFACVACSPSEVADEPKPTSPPVQSDVLAAYVLFAPPPPEPPTSSAGSDTPLAIARWIVDGTGPSVTCPPLNGPAGGAIPIVSKRENPHGFSVTVCEAEVPLGTAYTVEGANQTFDLPAANLHPDRIAVLGDSGCKDDHKQPCDAAAGKWLFSDVAGTAASSTPDLVVHVGDFNYRGTPSTSPSGESYYDAQGLDGPECELQTGYVSQNTTSGTERDNWPNWRDDFFVPAAALLAKAPLVAARGNHELCSRAGPGWFYFLDPSGAAAKTAQLSCPDQNPFSGGGKNWPIDPQDPNNTHILTRPAYTLELETLRLFVVDSANACDEYAPKATTLPYEVALEVLTNLPQTPPTWLVAHRPIWGLYTPDDSSSFEAQGLLQALPQGTWSAGWTLVVSGHLHRFQSFAFDASSSSSQRPRQLVIGNSGVKMGTDLTTSFKAHTGQGLQIGGTDYGYLEIELGSNGAWSGELKDDKGATIACCDDTMAGVCKQATTCSSTNGGA